MTTKAESSNFAASGTAAPFYETKRLLALADCNNFFVSCERRRDARLQKRPVVVLSGNDGCVVARSNEAKAAGVPMGVPLFKVEGLLKHIGCAILSGDIPYYSDVSQQVIEELRRWTPALENYSIDESFMDVAIRAVEDKKEYCRKIKESVMLRCGIPVSIGIAPTKTLAKLGSKFAKAAAVKGSDASGVCMIGPSQFKDKAFMSSVSAGDVWGVGPAAAKKLSLYYRIENGWQLSQADDLMLKARFSVNLLHTAWELRGMPVFPLCETRPAPKSIRVSRTFGRAVSELADLRCAVMYFICSAARQLRAAKQSACRLYVTARTSRFVPERDFFSTCAEARFPNGQNQDGELLRAADGLLCKIYRAGVKYAKAGVMLCDFKDQSCGRQMSLFDGMDGKAELAAAVADRINAEAGRVIIAPADHFMSNRKSIWTPKSEHGKENELPRLPLAPSQRQGF